MANRVVPECLREAIDEKIAAAFKHYPESAYEREILVDQMLFYFDQFGVLPDTLTLLKLRG